jgi:uncharacterized protein (DUF433 family)
LNVPLQWKDIARDGGFTTTDVAKLLGREPREIASWLRGEPPLIAPDYLPINGRVILSFAALVEARAIAHFVDEGVKLSKLRRILAEFRRRKREAHPLARDEAYVTDGFRLFEKDGDRLINLSNDVYAEPTLMKPALRGHVVYEGGRAAFLEPEPVAAPLVRIDPRHAFGKPVVVDGGRVVTTEALAASVKVEGLEAAAKWYGVSTSAARQALEYERRRAA